MFCSAAQFALTSRAYHNSSSFWLTLQVKSVAICVEYVTHWCVQHRFCQTKPRINSASTGHKAPVGMLFIELFRYAAFALP